MIITNVKRFKHFCKTHPMKGRYLGYLKFHAYIYKSMRQAELGETILWDEDEDIFYVE